MSKRPTDIEYLEAENKNLRERAHGWYNEYKKLEAENAKLRKKTQQIHKDVEDLRMDTEETKEGIEWSDNAPVEVRMAWCNLLRSSGVDENRWFGP